jgi:deoxyribonuclease-4
VTVGPSKQNVGRCEDSGAQPGQQASQTAKKTYTARPNATIASLPYFPAKGRMNEKPPRKPRRTSPPKAGARNRSGSARVVGAHQSIAGGLSRAVDRAVETGCHCLQIFTRNINRWDVSPIDPVAAEEFKKAVTAARLSLVVAHDSYLINPAAADAELRKKSIAGLVTELERAALLDIPWVVAHPGAAGEQPREKAVRRAADGIATALARTRGLAAGILIETTAGQGSCLGDSFEEIAAMLETIDAAGHSARVAVCLDTCHVFAAGYGLSPKPELDRTIKEFDAAIGLDRLKVIHANDSKRERGSRVDRHEAIGQGQIGADAFRLIMNHPRLATIPLILETPKEGPDGKVCPDQDRGNLALLRGFVGSA